MSVTATLPSAGLTAGRKLTYWPSTWKRQATRPDDCRACTESGSELLATPPAVTTTGSLPSAALSGAKATIDVSDQRVVHATWPPTVTTLDPFTSPKPLPVR